MLKIVLYAAMERSYNSRPIEEACKRDINYIWLLNGEPAPSSRAICRFRSELISKCGEELFYGLVKRLKEVGEIRYTLCKDEFQDAKSLLESARKNVAQQVNTELLTTYWQISSSLYERLLLSDGEANKEEVLALAQHGIEITQPSDIIRDPYVFEFLGIPEDKPFLESDLERALVQQIEKFLLELDRGFMFVGTQQRVIVNNTHYYVDYSDFRFIPIVA